MNSKIDDFMTFFTVESCLVFRSSLKSFYNLHVFVSHQHRSSCGLALLESIAFDSSVMKRAQIPITIERGNRRPNVLANPQAFDSSFIVILLPQPKHSISVLHRGRIMQQDIDKILSLS